MNKIDLHISKQLVKLRTEKQLTQDELAKMLGLKTRISVVNMEQGKQSFTTKTIYLLCCVFNITPNDLFPPIKNATVLKKRKVRIVKVEDRYFSVKGLPKV